MTAHGKKTFVFVVGAPRSGTTWLHHMLAAHPAVASMEQELTMIKYLADWDRHFQQEKFRIDAGHWQQGVPLLYGEDEFYQGLRALADQAYARVQARRPQASHVLDKHPDYALHVELIARLFPTCKVLHIIRDGREVAVSMMSAHQRVGFGAGEIRGAARHWARNLLASRRAGEQLGPDRYMEVRYEDLKADTAPELLKIYRFCQLPATPAEAERIAAEYDIQRKQVSRGDTTLNALRDVPGAIWKQELTLEQRWLLDRLAGPLLYELGYGAPGWWALSATEQFLMHFYPFRQRVLRSLGNLKHTWLTPLEQRTAH